MSGLRLRFIKLLMSDPQTEWYYSRNRHNQALNSYSPDLEFLTLGSEFGENVR